MVAEPLIWDWNAPAAGEPRFPQGFRIVDETLRDGIQCPSVRNPTADEKVELMVLADAAGVDVVDIGLPGAGADAVDDAARLAREIVDRRLRVLPNCAGRTHPADVMAVAEVSQRAGIPVEMCAFMGSSPIRQLVERWDIGQMVARVVTTGELCRREGLPFTFVTEDTTRAAPETLRDLYRAAIDHGATRLILCDTVGHATPDGVRRLLAFVREVIERTGAEVGIDWHGHNDRGLSLTLALTALEMGANGVHGTCLGVGERVGNTPLDQLLVNLSLLGAFRGDLQALGRYVDAGSRTLGIPIPPGYPVFGDDAFRTATGVHAAAIAKALEAGRADLADRVYSSVSAASVGRAQRIEVGFYSGRANVRQWLQSRGLEPTDARVDAVLRVAKSRRELLTESEIREILAGLDAV